MPLHQLPRGVLFDHDGVLVSSEEIHRQAWCKLLVELGLPDAEPIVRRSVGKTAPHILTEILNQYRPGWTEASYPIQDLVDRKNEHYLRIAESELEPYPGVRDLIAWLKLHGIRCGVVSNARRRELMRALEKLRLAPEFDVILSREDVPSPKPDPSAYLTGAAHLGLAPHQCLVVEDSPTGLESALLGKIPAAGILTNFTRRELQSPIPGRPDLHPIWIGESILDLHQELKLVHAQNKS